MDESSSVVKMMQSYINGSPNGMGFLIGVKAFAKLYRLYRDLIRFNHLFCFYQSVGLSVFLHHCSCLITKRDFNSHLSSLV